LVIFIIFEVQNYCNFNYVPNPAFRFNSSFFKLFFYAIARASFGRFAISRKNSLQKLWGFYCNLGQKKQYQCQY